MNKLFNSKAGKIILLVLVVALLALGVFACISKFKKAPNNASGEDVAQEEVEEPTHADILDQASEVADDGEQVLLMPKDEVSSFSITDANGILLTFEKQNDKWVYIDDSSMELNQSRMDKLLNYICDVHALEAISDASGEEYGLTQESPVFIVKDSQGNKTLISVGNITEDGRVYFALNYDFSVVYVNSGKLNNILSYSVEELVL